MPFLSKLFRKIKALFVTKVNRPNVCSPDSEEPEHPRIDRTILLSDMTLKCIFECYTYSTYVSVQDSGFISPLFVEADPRFGPLLLIQICVRWRRLAITMPHLWSSIHVGNNHHPELLREWLQRSRTLPLNLHLDCMYRPEEISQANKQQLLHPFETHPYLSNSRINEALKLVSTEVQRWQRLSLALDTQSSFAFMQTPLRHATNLEEIYVQVVVRDSYSVPTHILDVLNTSLAHLPSLKRLSWESIVACTSQIQYIFDNSHLWERLMEVQLKTGVTMSEAAAFLRMCVNASSVAIECITNDYVDDAELQITSAAGENWQRSDVPIVLPKLKDLSLGFGGAACDCTIILEQFGFPSLHTLRIYNFQTNNGSCDRIEHLLDRAASAGLDAVPDSRHSVGSVSLGLQRLLIKDEYMSEEIIVRLIYTPLLWRVPIVNCYTRRAVKREFLPDAIQNANIPKKVEFLEDSLYGKWIGWGGLPTSSQY